MLELVRLVKKGAEASVYFASWFGEPAIAKVRFPKAYRHEKLDRRIRVSRTSSEARFIREAREAGVPTPLIYFVDLKNTAIVMQYVDGPRLKDVLSPDTVGLCREVGRLLARLHMHGIVHNDPTTSNFILHKGRLVMVDFGLSIHSERLEDRAVDLHLLKEALAGGHSDIAPKAFSEALSGYSEVLGEGAKASVVRRVADIERRGRYA